MAVIKCKMCGGDLNLVEGNIIEAYETFVSLGNYKDSTEQAAAIYNQYKSAKRKNPSIGDYVFYGYYEQDNNHNNGEEEIEWLVLDIQDGKALLLSKYALEEMAYQSSGAFWEDYKWEVSEIRAWLNNDFLNSAFTGREQAAIPVMTVPAHKNPKYDTDPGNDTEDKVFLLSVDEVEKYLDSTKKRECQKTAYLIAKSGGSNDRAWWWLRTHGDHLGDAVTVDMHGNIDLYGTSVKKEFDVRPAIWIDLSLL